MDVVVAVICGNLAISIVALLVTRWMMRLRRQAAKIAICCDRWESECHQILRTAPAVLTLDREPIDNLRHLYQQQLVTLDRLRALGLFWGIARSLMVKRRLFNI